jgi:copper resistance protein C
MTQLGLKVVCAVLALTPSAGSAHAYLEASAPQHKAILDVAPSTIRLQFSEPLEAAFVKTAFKCDGKNIPGVPNTSVSQDRRTIMVEPPGPIAGKCLLIWSIVARDGHRTRGELAFSIGAR